MLEFIGPRPKRNAFKILCPIGVSFKSKPFGEGYDEDEIDVNSDTLAWWIKLKDYVGENAESKSN